MSIKIKVLCVLLALCVLNIEVNGKPQLLELGGLAAFGAAAMAIGSSQQCSAKGGCSKGYCWAYCGVSLYNGDWCYTTKSYSQSYQYVKCSKDSDCDLCWKCAGPCTLI